MGTFGVDLYFCSLMKTLSNVFQFVRLGISTSDEIWGELTRGLFSTMKTSSGWEFCCLPIAEFISSSANQSLACKGMQTAITITRLKFPKCMKRPAFQDMFRIGWAENVSDTVCVPNNVIACFFALLYISILFLCVAHSSILLYQGLT